MRSDVAAALALLPLLAPPSAGAQDWQTVGNARQLQDEEALDVRLEYAAGRFRLGQGPANMLYRLRSRYDANAFGLKSRYAVREGRGQLRVRLEGGGKSIKPGNFREYDAEAGQLHLGLSGEIPLNMRVKLGAAEAVLELGGLQVAGLELETGASDTRVTFDAPNPVEAKRCEFHAGAAAFSARGLGYSRCRKIRVAGGVGTISLDFSGDWSGDASAEVEVGLGTIEVNVPAEVGVRIERSTFLMSFEAPDFRKRDDAWLSPNWEDAEHHLRLKIRGALGTVEIRRD